MLKLVQNWFAPGVNPIGVDFGSDCLRMAQVQFSGGECRLVAAASADVPSHVRHNAPARLEFFVDTVRDLLVQGKFVSRQAVLALPASSMYIQHLRMAKLDEEETRKALPWEARGKIPIDPSYALMRHLIAGEVYQDAEARNEVIVMAAARELVNQLLEGAARARLDVVGMNVEPKATIDCFSHIYRRHEDGEAVTFYLDIGCGATRAFIARGQHIYFARSIPIGGDHFNKATSQALKISFDEAKLLRIKLCAAQPTAQPPVPAVAPVVEEPREKVIAHAPEPEDIANQFAILGAALQAKTGPTHSKPAAPTVALARPAAVAAPPSSLAEQALLVEEACREPLAKLVEEMEMCRRYYEATFPNQPVDRLLFIGGESRHRSLCQSIARDLGLAAQLGDPMVRLGRNSEIGIETGIDRRQPQPAWAVAIGLSLGPAGAAAAGAARGAARSKGTAAGGAGAS